MAEKEYPLAPTANGYSRSDTETASGAHAKELKRKKRMKCFIYIVAFAVFQTGIIALFGLTIMKFRTPKFRVLSATVTSDVGTPTTPSFNIKMNAELGVKNTNFGHYKYQNTTVYFYYRDTKVGEAFISRARAKARTTRKFNIAVDLSSKVVTSTSDLANDISAGLLPLSSTSRMRGKITIMKLMKKNRSTNMNCTMQLVVATKQLQNLMCR